MLFERRLRDGIHDGSITTIFRRWRRSQVVVGGRYRTGVDMIEVSAVDVVDAAEISDRQARLAGYPSLVALLADLRGTPEQPIYRIRLSRLAEPDTRDSLAVDGDLDATELSEIDRRLGRLDRASRRGPWTSTVLATIAARPGVAASILAESCDVATEVFKRNVRSLKALGLTRSQPVGYRLSARGEAYLTSRTVDRPASRRAEPDGAGS